MLERALHVAERVEVLQLGAGAEVRVAFGPDGDVGVAPQRALLEVAVADAGVAEHAPEPLDVKLNKDNDIFAHDVLVNRGF